MEQYISSKQIPTVQGEVAVPKLKPNPSVQGEVGVHKLKTNINAEQIQAWFWF